MARTIELGDGRAGIMLRKKISAGLDSTPIAKVLNRAAKKGIVDSVHKKLIKSLPFIYK